MVYLVVVCRIIFVMKNNFGLLRHKKIYSQKNETLAIDLVSIWCFFFAHYPKLGNKENRSKKKVQWIEILFQSNGRWANQKACNKKEKNTIEKMQMKTDEIFSKWKYFSSKRLHGCSDKKIKMHTKSHTRLIVMLKVIRKHVYKQIREIIVCNHQ